MELAVGRGEINNARAVWHPTKILYPVDEGLRIGSVLRHEKEPLLGILFLDSFSRESDEMSIRRPFWKMVIKVRVGRQLVRSLFLNLDAPNLKARATVGFKDNGTAVG